jgi:hypothetical protein
MKGIGVNKVVGMMAGLVLASSLALAGEESATAKNVGQWGVGYQGVLVGDFLQGISARSWRTDTFGVEGSFYHAMLRMNDDNGDAFEGQLVMGELKCLKALKVRDNSRFYAGLGVGGGTAFTSESDEKLILYWARPLIGAEYFFQGLPELGFNFEVGYGVSGASVENTDLQLIGINVGLGAHYYF